MAQPSKTPNLTKQDPLLVRKVLDFELTGDGDRKEWQNAQWNSLTKLDDGGKEYVSRFKIQYSSTGIYVLFNGMDDKITTTYDEDMSDMYNGDVFEVFFHPNPDVRNYFEYEVNQLDKELILLLTNSNGKSYSWAPWHYENNRRLRKVVKVVGGEAKSEATIKSWTAEVFFPNELLELLPNIPPKSGAVWNANFYRLDYDSGKMIKWSWSPTIKRSFHELENFGQIKFE
jgi:hypothetical protein